MKNSLETTDKKKPLDHFLSFIPFNGNLLTSAFVLILFGVLVFGLYSKTFNSAFVFDDKPKIEKNTYIRLTQLSPKNIIKAGFKSSKSRPIAFITFALNYYAHQYDRVGYHLVNITIHILTGFFLYLFIRTTLTLPHLQSRYDHPALIAFLASLLWLVNPVQTQSVTYIIQRMNSMASMLFVLSFWFYVKGRLAEGNWKKWLWFANAVLFWLVSLGCKQITATLPFLVYLYEFYFFQDLNRDWLKRSIKWALAIIAVFVLLVLIYTGFNPLEKFVRFTDYVNKEFTLTQRVLTQLRVVVFYISLFFYPHPNRLNLDHDFPLSYSLVDPLTTLLCLILIIGLITLAVVLARKQRLVSFCILWFFGNLVIESSIIPLAIIYDHRVYLPSMLVSLLTVCLIYKYIRLRWVSISIVCASIGLCSFWTFERNKVWQNELTFWRDCLKKSPNKARPHYNLGVYLQDEKMVEDAIHHYRKSLEINPRYYRAYYNLGTVFVKQDKPVEAEEHYRMALEIAPTFVEAYNSLGHALVEQDKIDEAIENFRKALQIKPDYAKAHLNLGDALAKQGKLEEAVEHQIKAVQIDPDFAAAHNNLGLTLLKQGKLKEAEDHYRKAVQIKPEFTEAHNNWGVVLEKQGRLDEAVEHYQTALQITPDYDKAYNNMGSVRVKQGKLDEAVKHFQDALQIKPDSAEAHFNLGDALAKQGKTDQAIHQFNTALHLKPDYAEVHNNLGGELLRQGRLDEAQAHLNAALKLDPEIAQAHNNLGIILIQQGDVEQAIVHFKEALRIKPDFDLADANLKRAMAVQNRMQIEGDAAELEQALKNKPDNPVLHFEMGNLFLSKGDVNQAINQFENALAIQPDYPQALNNLAMAYAADKQYNKALDAFKKMTALQPDNASHYYNVAVLYALQTKVEESLEWLKKAIDKGYTNWELIKTDKDLENIRNSAGYKELVKGH
jgi:tetratricopeptide (TPR) repeat protein